MSNRLELNITKQDLIALVEKLPEQFKHVILLYFLNNLTIKDISKEVNLGYGTTRNRLSKGIYLLKKISATSFAGNQAESQSVS